ncbi:type II secretion system secretin GspD [Aliiroseovarius halocynthiae]|uniref:type II secretion system secretin GspD n=1 Tax=Aliiroseovarius halocynthiae TaxID=985055 RepID=UPI00163D425D|nr:type II secretion system secretin GspD [Aliiroseovarius halocynthiae]
MLFTLVACDAGSGKGGSQLLANQKGGSGSSGSAFQRFADSLTRPAVTRRSLGTDEFLAGTANKRELISVSDSGAFTLNLVDVPIKRAAKAVLGDALKKNYTIQPGVEGSVTLQTTRPLSERALLDTFQTILELNGAALETSGDLIKIVSQSSGTRRISRVEDAVGVGARVVAVPLEYIGTAEMMRLLEPITGQNVRLQPIPKRNILLIAGNREELNATIDAINLFDVDVLKGKSVGLFKLNAAEPEAIVEELSVVFENEEGGSLQNVITFVPSQRLSAVIVITSRQKYLARAERWIRDLDRTARGSRRRPVVYAMQNRSAEELAPILNEMLKEVAQEEGGQVEGAPKIVADNAKNALIIWGNENEQNNFSRLIQSLDTTPVQVLLEATIAEVRLNDELNFGLRWFFENKTASATFSDSQSGSVGASFPGLSLLFQGASASVALNALNSVTDVDVVSSPSLMVLDNQEAKLQIGDEVPIATQQVRDTSNPNAPVVNTISFRNTGILLTVRPRVSNSGQVTLDIEQEVSSVSSTTSSGIDSPTISQRRIETSVVVTDGQTIALGGLIEESRNRTNSKVPGAGDVPVLGALFRNRRDQARKTELLVLITPKVIRNGNSSRQITEEIRARISGANGLIQNGIVIPDGGHRIID